MDTAALAPIVVILVALQVYCLYDLSRSSVRYLPKWGWAAVLLVGGLAADVAYFALGREQR
jgi:hypothetical protein